MIPLLRHHSSSHWSFTHKIIPFRLNCLVWAHFLSRSEQIIYEFMWKSKFLCVLYLSWFYLLGEWFWVSYFALLIFFQWGYALWPEDILCPLSIPKETQVSVFQHFKKSRIWSGFSLGVSSKPKLLPLVTHLSSLAAFSNQSPYFDPKEFS